jgi:hypothetical protein
VFTIKPTVLPSNSPGVHTLWLPIIPLQIGLVLKPGPQEPWTPYRMAQAFIQAGVPKQAIAIYPGLGDIGAAVLQHCPRNLIFGGTATVEQYKGNPRVQAHGPGFSKILLGDDQVDHWEKYLDIMVDSVLVNSGREATAVRQALSARNVRSARDHSSGAGPRARSRAGRSPPAGGRAPADDNDPHRMFRQRRHRTRTHIAADADFEGDVGVDEEGGAYGEAGGSGEEELRR